MSRPPAGAAALWLFGELIGSYPSSILIDPIGRNILALGLGARICPESPWFTQTMRRRP